MRSFSLKYAQENLEHIALETIDNDEETVITLDSSKAVIMIPLDRWNASQKIQYLSHNFTDTKSASKSIE